jgi:hypothetical protein
MSTVLLCGAIGIGVSLLRMHKDKELPSLSDLITATDKKGKARLDARKCFEAGCFLASTWAFVFLTASGKLTEFFFVGYMGSWVGARYLRDREKRLSVGK